MGFPIDAKLHRRLPVGFAGEVFVADIDRTYLATRFSSLRGIARIPFETAADKEDIAGMARLFREIRRGPQARSRETPLFFVSASPAQLRPVIERKLVLDGIGFDGTIFKDWLAVFRALRLSRLREQIGFKLTALLVNRSLLPVGAHEVLLGDDLESDPLAFAIYADLIAGRLTGDAVVSLLRGLGVSVDDARDIAGGCERFSGSERVTAAYIRLERYSDPAELAEFGGNLIGCRSAFQTAVALWDAGSIAMEGVARVAAVLLREGADHGRLVYELQDCSERAIVDAERILSLARRLVALRVLAAFDSPGQPSERWLEHRRNAASRSWVPPRYME